MSRVVVQERRSVAEMLAGGAGVAPRDLMDAELRDVARAVAVLRVAREAPTDELLVAVVGLLGGQVDVRDLEALRREGALRRAA